MENEIKIFENQNVKLEVNMKDETVWLSLDQMSKLFDRDKSVISRHIKNAIAEEGVPCGNEKCQQCENLKGAIAVIDRYVDILMGRFDC